SPDPAHSSQPTRLSAFMNLKSIERISVPREHCRATSGPSTIKVAGSLQECTGRRPATGAVFERFLGVGDNLAVTATTGEKSGSADSNRGPLVPQTSTLTT